MLIHKWCARSCGSILLILATCLASAQSGNLSHLFFNSGQAVHGVNIGPGLVDPHFTLDNWTCTTMVADPVWAGDTPDSMWLSNGQALPGGGWYTFRYRFDLTGYDPSTASITGFWTADNSAWMKLNGVLVDTEPDFNYGSMHGYAATTGFVEGMNEITYEVFNGLYDSNQTPIDSPMGLRVQFTTVNATPVPEPGIMTTICVATIAMIRGKRR